MSDPDQFKYVAAPWVIALGNDIQVVVWRSEVLSKSSLEYAPVKAHLEAHQMQLVEETLLPKDKHLYGRTFKSWFAVPSVRTLLAEFPAEES